MTKAVFVIGVMDKTARAKYNPTPLSDEDMALLGQLADDNGLDVEIVFGLESTKFAGDEKRPKLADIKKERPRLVEQITQAQPQLTICFGRVAAAAVFGKGSIVLDAFRRAGHTHKDIPGDIYVCDSLQRLAVQPGVLKHIERDVYAFTHGFVTTTFGDYKILQPGTREWRALPKQFGPLVGFDIETYPGLDPYDSTARIRMAMISDAEGEAYVVQATDSGELPLWLTNILADTAYLKAGSNIAFDCRWCSRFGYPVNNVVDTSTMEHVLDCTDPNKGLKWLVMSYLPRLGNYERELEALRKKRGKKGDWHLLLDSEMYQYAGADAEGSYVAAKAQLAKIHGSWAEVPQRMMADLYPVLTDMYIGGLRVDRAVTIQLDADMDRHLTELRQQIQSVLGPINVNSHVQLAKGLMAVIPGIDLTIKQVAKYLQADDDDEEDEEHSTSKAVLEREAHKHPVVAMVLEFRQWSKLHSAFIRALLDKHLVFHDGAWYCHPAYNTAIVETYRLSSSKPNIQQVPRKSKDATLNIKRQFVPSHPNGFLLNADYSQMEMRVAAMQSGDPALIAALNTEDIHLTTAEMMYRVPKGTFTKESHERQHAKTVGFATMYGAGAKTIGKQLGIPKDDAKELIKLYFKAYPGLKRYIEQVHKQVMVDCEVTTPFGFKRKFRRPPKDNWNQWEGFRVLRQAFNTIVQSTAACIMYVALVDIDRELKQRGLKSRLLNTVHDSLLVDVYPGELAEVKEIVVRIMQAPDTARYGVELTVPLGVDIEVGQSWGTLEKVD
jgi:DNA polymerase-1